ncbi:helitron_like_N domain-containing protein [Trichonephila clavipes]|nr:helitron_like_N domain-containing protein [Trichonephila clavipes]
MSQPGCVARQEKYNYRKIETPLQPLNGLVIGAETNKNVSSKDYYAYRLMIRRDQDNVILRCRELCQQFIVNMYGKIESERL